VSGQPPRVPVSDQDRERLLALLREHYARGHLDHPALDHRVGRVLGAQFADEAEAALAGLPALTGPGAAGPAAARDRRRPRRRGHAQAARPESGWVPTPERFRDPTSQVIMRVWIDPSDGSRHYVPDG
jgi:Domain of unknown function (DUF1707)